LYCVIKEQRCRIRNEFAVPRQKSDEKISEHPKDLSFNPYIAQATKISENT
jgi:hypothetical protein